MKLVFKGTTALYIFVVNKLVANGKQNIVQINGWAGK